MTFGKKCQQKLFRNLFSIWVNMCSCFLPLFLFHSLKINKNTREKMNDRLMNHWGIQVISEYRTEVYKTLCLSELPDEISSRKSHKIYYMVVVTCTHTSKLIHTIRGNHVWEVQRINDIIIWMFSLEFMTNPTWFSDMQRCYLFNVPFSKWINRYQV